MNTHTRNLVRATLFALALSGLATPASAIITTFDSSAQAGWVDTMLSQSEPTTTKGTVDSMQMNGLGTDFGLVSTDAHMIVLSFGTLTGIAETDTVNQATLNLTYNFSSSGQTFNVYGLTGTVDNTLTWNSPPTGFDPTSPGTALSSFTTLNSAATNSAIAIDLTAAIAAYVRGDITGIAIGTTATNPNSDAGTDQRVLFNTSDHLNTALRPSLTVDYVPEPATCALVLGLACGGLLMRRRRATLAAAPAAV